MNTPETLAPAVRDVLDAASVRPDPERRVRVTAHRSLTRALANADAAGRVPIVAEIKPTSPTTDGTRAVNPVQTAKAMVEAGAAAISVLTEPDHFGGSPETLETVRNAVEVPVLRKDFILREAQLDAVSADAVLLIARFVEDLPGLVSATRDRGMTPLVEVHSRQEVERAVEAGGDLIGINNRDLARLNVDLGTFEAVAPAVPDDVTLIAESGISTPADARRMCDAGADGLLVGSAIMGAEDGAGPATRRLVEAGR